MRLTTMALILLTAVPIALMAPVPVPDTKAIADAFAGARGSRGQYERPRSPAESIL